MHYFKRRHIRKGVKHLLHESRHIRHMKEDIRDPAHIEALRAAEDDLRAALKQGDYDAVESLAEKVQDQAEAVLGPVRHSKIRENVEVIAVAVAVAMGFRAYFAQPFKIPTGSMQPTLYGIIATEDYAKTVWDHFPMSWIKIALFGEYVSVVKAKTTGYPNTTFKQNGRWPPSNDGAQRVYIGGVPHKIRDGMKRFVDYDNEDTYVKKGDVLAAGRVRLGDHIFVNKMKYNFFPPERGDVIVFETRGIKHPQIRPDAYYIKRCAGLPGERIRIENRHLVADGHPITEPYPFERLLEDEGYNGYRPAGWPASVRSEITDPDIHIHSAELIPLDDYTWRIPLVIQVDREKVINGMTGPFAVHMKPIDGVEVQNYSGYFSNLLIGYRKVALHFTDQGRYFVIPEQTLESDGLIVRTEKPVFSPSTLRNKLEFRLLSVPMCLNEEIDMLVLEDDQYLPLGDNTTSSLDGRFFGGVERKHLMGPAFIVYWPLSNRWGPIR